MCSLPQRESLLGVLEYGVKHKLLENSLAMSFPFFKGELNLVSFCIQDFV